jgi:hypothetical protein
MRLLAWRIANFFASNDKNFSVTPARGLARRDLAVGGPAGAGPDPAKHAKMEKHDESGCNDAGGPFRALPLSSEIRCDAWATGQIPGR